MPPNSHPNNYEILIDFLMICSRFLEPKWEARGTRKASEKRNEIEGKWEAPPRNAPGTKGSQNVTKIKHLSVFVSMSNFRCDFRPISSKPILPNISANALNVDDKLKKDSFEGL